VKRLFFTGIVALFLATPASAEKMTMQCGDIEALVTVQYIDGKRKIDIYPTDSHGRTLDAYVENGNLYINDEKCVPTKHWICPADDKVC
jgi:hypothetical protein